ncbi:MAG: glycerol kinase GlpK [Coraliomargaritaceae bacterium]
MPRDYILALDQGTTSSRALLINREGHPIDREQSEFSQHFPKDGWVEHNADEIWTTQSAVAISVLSRNRIGPEDIAAIGIANQRETTVLWNRHTGRPLHRAIVWQDRRTAGLCQTLRAEGLETEFQEKTGLRLDPYFSGTKLKWLLDNVPDAREQAARGELAFGTIDCWLLWNLTCGRIHKTDATNASRTLLFNIHEKKWDSALLHYLQIPESILPEVCPSAHLFGEATCTGLEGIPVAGMAGDQQAALFGQTCFAPGQAKNTYGTGCFLLRPSGKKPIYSEHNLLTTLTCSTENDTPEYAVEGSVFIGGAVIQWLRDALGLIKDASESEAVAQSVPDSGGIHLVPAFSGLGAPHWEPSARGTLCGMTRSTSAAHIVRAALESIAFQSADLLRAMDSDHVSPLNELRVDGGASRNDFLMQFQSDLMQVPVLRPKITETTALGVAYLAGLTTGIWKDRSALAEQWQIEKRFEPKITAVQARDLEEGWLRALTAAKAWSPT